MLHVHPLISDCVYAKRDLHKDILVGTCKLSLSGASCIRSVTYLTFDLLSFPHVDIAGDSGSSQPAKLHLTLGLSADPSSLKITTDDTSILITTKLYNRRAEGSAIPSIPQHTLDFSIPTAAPPSEPLSPLIHYISIESGATTPPTADGQGGVSPSKIVLHDSNDAMKTMKLDNAWENVIERIKWVMDAVSPIAEVRLSFYS